MKRGFWQRKRFWVHRALLAFFLVLPFLRQNHLPLFQFNVLEQRFHFFGGVYRSHHVPQIVMIVLAGLILFALFSTFYGRLWCGFACPLTTVLDQVVRPVDRWAAKYKIPKLPLHLLISGVFGFWTSLYFVRHEQWSIEGAFVEHALPFWIVFSTLVFIVFTLFREKFCIYLCPYGRLQSLFLQPFTRVVSFQKERGDCIDCLRCVKVCPTGIDIRDGTQMECVFCMECVDACDFVMGRIRKPQGLLEYRQPSRPKSRLFAFQPVLYAAVFLGLWLGWQHFQSRDVQMEVFRAKTPSKEITIDGHKFISNDFIVDLRARDDRATMFRISSLAGGLAEFIVTVPPGERQPQTVTLRVSEEALSEEVVLRVEQSTLAEAEVLSAEHKLRVLRL